MRDRVAAGRDAAGGGQMRKRYWMVLAIMLFGGAGNLIGRTDTSGRAVADPGVSVPFDAMLYVSASTLNLRAEPSTSADILAKLPRNARLS